MGHGKRNRGDTGADQQRGLTQVPFQGSSGERKPTGAISKKSISSGQTEPDHNRLRRKKWRKSPLIVQKQKRRMGKERSSSSVSDTKSNVCVKSPSSEDDSQHLEWGRIELKSAKGEKKVTFFEQLRDDDEYLPDASETGSAESSESESSDQNQREEQPISIPSKKVSVTSGKSEKLQKRVAPVRARRKPVQIPIHKSKNPLQWGTWITRTFFEWKLRPNEGGIPNSQGRVTLRKGWAYYLGQELSKVHLCPFIANQGHMFSAYGSRCGYFLYAQMKCPACGFQIQCRIKVRMEFYSSMCYMIHMILK